MISLSPDRFSNSLAITHTFDRLCDLHLTDCATDHHS